MKRLLKFLIMGVGVLVLLLVLGIGVLVLFVDLDKVVNEQIAKARPQIEAKLGRKVEIGKVTTRLLPVLGGRVENVTIGPDTTQRLDDRPLVKVGSVGFDVALLKAIVSLGKTIVVKDVYLDGLKVNLIRYPGGRLSYQDILDRQPKPAPETNAPAAAEPLSAEVLEYVRAVSVDELRVSDAEIRLADYDTPTGKLAEDFVRKLDLRVQDVRLKDPIHLRISAALFAERPNFELETTVGPLPQDLQLKGLPAIAGLKLRASQVDLGKLAPYLGPAVPVKIQSALLSTSWDVGEIGEKKPVPVAGSLTVAQLQLQGGKAFDLSLDAKLDLDLKDLGVAITRLLVKVGKIDLEMAGAVRDLAKTPRFSNFTIRSTTIDLARLLEYYPAAGRSLPPGTKVDGPIRLDVKASGDAQRQAVVASADLAQVDLLYPGTLVKPRGTAFGLRVDGDFSNTDAALRSLGLVLDELDLVVKGTVKNFGKPVVDLTLAAKPFSFDRVARLLPSVSRSLADQNAKASGDGSLSGYVKGSEDNVDASLDLGLTGVKLDVPGTKLDGDLKLAVKAKGNPKRDLKASLALDADKAVIQVKDTVDKAAQTPLLLQVEAERRGEIVSLQKLALVFAELKLDATGTFDLAQGTTALSVTMPRLDLEKFSKTVTAIPADKAKKAFFDANVAVTGNPNKLETMSLDLTSLDVRLGRSDVQGKIRIANLVKPKAELDIRSQLLDLDELSGPPAQEKKPAAPQPEQQPGQRKVQKDDPSLKDYRASGRVDLKRVVVSQTDLTDFRGEIELADGVLTLKECTLRAFDGVVSAKGTRAEIWRARMPFQANLEIRGMDLNRVLSAKTKYPNTLYGRTDLEVKAQGEGFETEELEQKLLGSLRVALNDGKLAKASLTQSVLGDFSALDKVPGVATQKAAKAVASDNTIKNLAASIDIRDGKLHLRQPVTFSLDGNKVVLGGAIGIAGKLFLNGEYFVPPAIVSALTGGKCKATGDLRVPVAVVGSITTPEFRPDAAPVLGGLVQACLQGQAGAALKDAAKAAGVDTSKVLPAGVTVPTSTEDAERQAREQAARAQAEAEARAKAELEKQKREAEEKAKQEAGKLLKGLFGK